MRPSLLKNFSFLTASNILMPVTSMALVIAISRLGGVEMMGQYALLISFSLIGRTCSTAGLHILITRDVARSRDLAGAYFLSASLIGSLAALLISMVLLPAFAWSVPDHIFRLSLTIMAVALVPTVVATFGESVLLAFERAQDFVAINLLESLVRTAIATGLVCLGGGVLAIAAVFLACRTAAAVMMVLAIRYRGARLTLSFDRATFSQLARELPVVGMIPIVNSLYWRLDTLLLTSLRGIAEVGYYGASTRILDITRSLPTAYGRALYPVLSRLHHDEPSEFRRLSRDSLMWIVIATFPLSLVTFGLSHWIITVLYGANMAPAATALQIVAWVMIPYALTSTLAQVLFATGNQVFDLRTNLCALVTSVALNLVLIPRWGFVGASVASLGSMMVHVSLQYMYVRRQVFDPGLLDAFARTVATGLGAWVVMLLVGGRNPALATAAGFTCYTLGLWLTGLVKVSQVRWTLRRVITGAQGLRRAVPAVSHEPPVPIVPSQSDR